MAALVQNPSPGMAQQAALAPWLRQAIGQISPIQHPNPPAAPWYQGQMDQRQAAQAEMVRQWQAKQDAAAKAAADAAERDRLLHAGDDNRSGWVKFRDGPQGPKSLFPSAVQIAAGDPLGGILGAGSGVSHTLSNYIPGLK